MLLLCTKPPPIKVSSAFTLEGIDRYFRYLFYRSSCEHHFQSVLFCSLREVWSLLVPSGQDGDTGWRMVCSHKIQAINSSCCLTAASDGSCTHASSKWSQGMWERGGERRRRGEEKRMIASPHLFLLLIPVTIYWKLMEMRKPWIGGRMCNHMVIPKSKPLSGDSQLLPNAIRYVTESCFPALLSFVSTFFFL